MIIRAVEYLCFGTCLFLCCEMFGFIVGNLPFGASVYLAWPSVMVITAIGVISDLIRVTLKGQGGSVKLWRLVLTFLQTLIMFPFILLVESKVRSMNISPHGKILFAYSFVPEVVKLIPVLASLSWKQGSGGYGFVRVVVYSLVTATGLAAATTIHANNSVGIMTILANNIFTISGVLIMLWGGMSFAALAIIVPVFIRLVFYYLNEVYRDLFLLSVGLAEIVCLYRSLNKLPDVASFPNHLKHLKLAQSEFVMIEDVEAFKSPSSGRHSFDLLGLARSIRTLSV